MRFFSKKLFGQMKPPGLLINLMNYFEFVFKFAKILNFSRIPKGVPIWHPKVFCFINEKISIFSIFWLYFF
jgi:hypothetical protein